MKDTNVFVVILNWNRPEDTIECAKSVSRSLVLGYRLSVVIVDNGSTDESLAKLRYLKINKNINLTIIENRENLGFAGGNNVGIRYSMQEGADYVAILNNDTIAHPSLIIRMVERAKKDSKAGLVSPKIYFAQGYEFHKKRYKKSDIGKVIWYAGGIIDWDNVYGSNRGVDKVDKGQYDRAKVTDFATGTCMLISGEVLRKVGIFDEKYYMYYEDTDLSERVKKQGFKILFEPSAVVWHKVAQSSGIGSGLNDYFTSRNRLLFGMKYASLRTKFALIRECIKILLIGRKWQKVGIIDFYLGRLGRGSWE